ncbi:MAG: hypothetical protein N3F66_12940 [Spirochaetes bacterium]|nr:hypothetical protein [Spirochaetota bacterium]
MSKRIILCLCIALLFIITSPIHAQTLVGIKGGYFGWRPFLNDWQAGMFENIDIGYGFLGGPVIGIPLNDVISLSVSGLFGKQSFHWSLPYDQRVFQQGGPPTPSEGTYIFDEIRYDIDTALSVTILENVKLFAGYKYQKLDIAMEYTEVRWTPNAEIYYQKIDVTFPSHSLAVGAGINHVISDIFFITGNISLLYGMQSKMDITIKATARDDSGSITSGSFTMNESLTFKLWGMNVEPSVGAKISPSLVATLGARIQWLLSLIHI